MTCGATVKARFIGLSAMPKFVHTSLEAVAKTSLTPCTHTRTHKHTHTHKLTLSHALTHTHTTCTHANTHTHTHMQIHTNAHIHMYTHAHTHKLHPCTHTQTQALSDRYYSIQQNLHSHDGDTKSFIPAANKLPCTKKNEWLYKRSVWVITISQIRNNYNVHTKYAYTHISQKGVFS